MKSRFSTNVIRMDGKRVSINQPGTGFKLQCYTSILNFNHRSLDPAPGIKLQRLGRIKLQWLGGIKLQRPGGIKLQWLGMREHAA